MKRDLGVTKDQQSQFMQNTLVVSVATECSGMSLGTFAYRIIDEQVHYILSQEKGVILDRDPEYLHQMRVGFRRFQAAIAVFRPALRGRIDYKQGKRVLKILGTLRDLDVQLQGIEMRRKQASTPGAQKSLMRLQRDLKPKRSSAYKQVYKALKHKPAYQSFKHQTQAWLQHPKYQAIAGLSVEYCVPELLSPSVSRLLLHPAWLLPKTAMIDEVAFHDLRKLCKQVRYQGEFFLPFYPKEFKRWVKEIKSIQSELGQLQDAYVFGQFVRQYQPERLTVRKQNEALEDCSISQDWDMLQQRYTDPDYRRHLHQLILSPKMA